MPFDKNQLDKVHTSAMPEDKKGADQKPDNQKYGFQTHTIDGSPCMRTMLIHKHTG